jgi:hypothetical protein
VWYHESLNHIREGAPFVAPATGVAPAHGPVLTRPVPYRGAPPIIFCRTRERFCLSLIHSATR